MKKIIFILIFLLTFLFIPNVSALTLGSPSVYYYENGVAYSSTVSTDNWSSTPVYVGTYIGNFGSNFPNITRVDYNWFNLNLCSGKNVSVSGSVHAIFGFFLNQSYTLSFYMNNEQLVCSTQIFDNGNALHYDCYGDVGGGTFSIYLTENSFTTNLNYHTGVSQDITYSCDVSNEAIVNQSITNTQNIINNQNSNTNQIIQDNQQNTQDIINNQNQNTQQEIESQKVCSIIDKSSISTNNNYLTSTGVLTSSSTWGITDYIKYNSSSVLKKLNTDGNAPSVCFYNINKTLISCSTNNSVPIGIMTVPSDTSYIRFSIYKTNNKPQYELCVNGNQSLNDTLTSDEAPNTNQNLTDMEDYISSDTPISDLITMPLTLISSYINGVNSSCSPYNLGSLLGTNLIMPCIDIESKIGSNLWGIIDILFSLFMCYNIGMLFITAFDGITSLRDDFEGLYQPRHADIGYKPKHGGD